MGKVLVFGINPYSVKESTCFFRHQVSPVKAFPVFAAHQLELLAVNKFILPVLVEMAK